MRCDFVSANYVCRCSRYVSCTWHKDEQDAGLYSAFIIFLCLSGLLAYMRNFRCTVDVVVCCCCCVFHVEDTEVDYSIDDAGDQSYVQTTAWDDGAQVGSTVGSFHRLMCCDGGEGPAGWVVMVRRRLHGRVDEEEEVLVVHEENKEAEDVWHEERTIISVARIGMSNVKGEIEEEEEWGECRNKER